MLFVVRHIYGVGPNHTPNDKNSHILDIIIIFIFAKFYHIYEVGTETV